MAIPGNLLSYNQESMETGIASYHAGSNTTVARSTAHAREGTHSLAVTVTGTTGDTYFNLGSDSVAGVQTATTFYFWAYTDASGVTAQVELDYENSSSAYVGYDSFNKQGRAYKALTPGAWTQVVMDTPSAGADATTDRFYGYLYFMGAAVNDVVYVDEVFYGTPTANTVEVAATLPLDATATIPATVTVDAALVLAASTAIPEAADALLGLDAAVTIPDVVYVEATLSLDATVMLPPNNPVTPDRSSTQPALNRSAPLGVDFDLLVYETVTGNIVTELPYTKLTWNTPLDTNGGKCSATIPLTAPELEGVNVRALTTPWRFSLLVAMRDKVMWFGPITPGRTYDGGDTVDIPASELWALLKARVLVGNLDTVGKNGELPTDLTLTAADLPSLCVKVMRTAMQCPGGSLPIRLPDAVDGSAHTRTYQGTQITTAADALGKLTEAEDGPDIRFDAEFVGDRRKARWAMRCG